MKRLLCFVLGHAWTVRVMSPSKHAWLGHLHTLAGCMATCDRCKKVWNDLPTVESSYYGDEIVVCDAGDVPEARVVRMRPRE